jgi:hypothetical protein
MLTCNDAHTRANRGAIALAANQLDFDPILLIAAIARLWICPRSSAMSAQGAIQTPQ